MPKKRTLLERGSCQKNEHEIRSEADVKIWEYKGAIRMACVACVNEQKRPQPTKDRHNAVNPRQLFLKCTHEALFTAPVPLAGDVIYCRKCCGYTVVEKWGATIEKKSLNQ